MKTNVERVGPVINLEIEGRPPMQLIGYEEALAALDRAYTEEIRETVARMRAMLGPLTWAAEGLKTICDEIEERHLGVTPPPRFARPSSPARPMGEQGRQEDAYILREREMMEQWKRWGEEAERNE